MTLQFSPRQPSAPLTSRLWSALLLGCSLLTLADVASANSTAATGPHLFGRSSIDDTASATYVIFHIYQQRVFGAFYQRFSSFDCFYGQITPTHLDLTVIDSFTSTAHSYALPTAPAPAVVAQAASTPLPIQPVGFHRVQQIQETDRQVLNICLENHLPQPLEAI